ncbi:MAG: hypothetical protein ACREAK_00880 [Nitrosarchaeum sp.]
MIIKNKKMTSQDKIVILIISISTIAILPTLSSAHAISSEYIEATTDKKIYQYGEPIQLTFNDINNGPKNIITEFKDSYPGIKGPCGIAYVDFVFLNGDYSKVKNFDELVSLTDQVLNVVHGTPYSMIMCPFTVKNFDSVNFDPTSKKAIINAGQMNGESLQMAREFIASYEITNVYGKTLTKEIEPGQEQEYVESKILPVGNYTIIAFSMAGEISKPVVIEVTDNDQKNTSFKIDSVATQFTNTINLLVSGQNVLSLMSLPLIFGSVMFVSFKRSDKLSKRLNIILVVTLISLTMIPQSGQYQAFATYNVSSQGLEAHSTTSTFKTATTEVQSQGIKYAVGANNGFSVQNNQFVQGFTVGNGFLWSQSLIQAESATGTTWNSHTCTTQSGSISCQLPSSVNLRGVYNFWTDDSIFNSCPTGFTYDSATDECYKAAGGAWVPVTLSSTKTRLDLNTFQEIQTGGIKMIQKYRSCTGSFTCDAYTTVKDWSPLFAYANSGSRFDLGTPPSGTRWGTQAVVGQCGSCNGGLGDVPFLSGTYLTEKYTINSSGSPIMKAAGAIDSPSENNTNLCWWNSITNPGGTNPTYSVTATYGTTCSS